ncbi:hypothetical protein OG937_37335 [Streptomyces sp. NBC_00510]
MHEFAAVLAGAPMSPRGEAVIMLLMGLGMTVFGLFGIRHTRFWVAYDEQAQQDAHDAYGWVPAPTSATRKASRIKTKIVGSVFAIAGPTLAIIGTLRLVEQ